MRKVFVKNQIKLLGIKNFKGKDKLIDYYIVQPDKDDIYVFSKAYTQNTYDLCKSGIRINDLTIKRTRDCGVMRLVNYLNLMMPYLCEYYDIPLAS